MEANVRRNSWAKALDRVRQAMKRRSSSARNQLPQPAPLGPTDQEATQPTTSLPANVAPRQTQKPATLPAETSPLPTEGPSDIIAIDTGMDADSEDDFDEPLLPVHPSRTGISQDRARELFAKYGLQYDIRGGKRPQQEPPTKIRRVEKPVRLRVHWTCHECRRQFGIEKVCTCGHRRCRSCARHPPKRIKELVDNTRREMEEAERQRQEVTNATDVSVDPDLERYRAEPAVTVVAGPSSAHTGPASTTQLDVDDSAQAQQPISSAVNYPIYTRPRRNFVMKPKAQIVRRTCHKCGTHIHPAGGSNCSNCGHTRCELCPRYPPRREQWTESQLQLAREEAPMVKAVQRVYRKPRQRVRYTCENCNTLFIDSDRCGECGHERCRECHREPPKRPPTTYDPDIIQAVHDRLAEYRDSAGQ